MEHAKKLVLIDPRILEKLMTAKDKVLSNLESEMTDVLSSNIPDDVKAKLYAAGTKRHATITEGEKKEESIKPDKNVSDRRYSDDILNDVIRTVPATHIPNTMKLVDFIKRQPRIDFNERGEMILDKRIISDTHAVDLINEVVRRKNMNANGSIEFASMLKEVNCPKELIVNPTYRKYMRDDGKNLTSRRKKGIRIGRSQVGSGKKNKVVKKKNVKRPFTWIRY